MIQKGISSLRHESPVPERTKESMQENTHWIKEKVKK